MSPCPLCARSEAILLEIQVALDRILRREPLAEAVRVIRRVPGVLPEWDDRARELPIQDAR